MSVSWEPEECGRCPWNCYGGELYGYCSSPECRTDTCEPVARCDCDCHREDECSP